MRYIIAFVFLSMACKPSSDRGEFVAMSDGEVGELISSNDPDKMVKGFYLVGEKKIR